MRFWSLGVGLAAWAGLSAGCSEVGDDEPVAHDHGEDLGVAVSAISVAQAVNAGCSTVSVKGLSLQIIEQANCLEPGAFVEVPDRPNLELGQAVFPFLEEPARDAFVAALDAHPGTTLSVNSMLRTAAQQYLLYAWYLAGTCGISLAAKPGLSNHETGLAADVSQYNTWKPWLAAEGFSWLGANDPVHFDYSGPGAVDHGGLDVLAFQMLWNLNHPDDLIDEDGLWGPQTENRMKASPADGFAIGPNCDPTPPPPPPPPEGEPKLTLSAGFDGAADSFADGASAGIVDVLVGEGPRAQFLVANAGDAVAQNIRVRVELEDAFLSATDWLVESDWMAGGSFAPNSANDNALNPPHGVLLPGSFDLELDSFSPGETKRITLDVQADAYSVARDEPTWVRLFVRSIPERYSQDEWGGAITQDGSQTYNDGRLELAAPLDVYAPDECRWDSNRREGWEAFEGATAARTDGDGLGVLRIDATAGYVERTSLDLPSAAGFTLRARRLGPGEVRAWVATGGGYGSEPLVLTIQNDGAFHDVFVRPSAQASLGDTITALRLEGAELELDSLTAGGTPNDDPPSALTTSCACGVAGGRGGSDRVVVSWLGLALGALAFARRRRA